MCANGGGEAAGVGLHRPLPYKAAWMGHYPKCRHLARARGYDVVGTLEEVQQSPSPGGGKTLPAGSSLSDGAGEAPDLRELQAEEEVVALVPRKSQGKWGKENSREHRNHGWGRSPPQPSLLSQQT